MLENTKEKMSRQLKKSYVIRRQEKKCHKSVVGRQYQMLSHNETMTTNMNLMSKKTES